MNKKLTVLLATFTALMMPTASAAAAPRCDDKTTVLQTQLADQHFAVGAIDGCDGAATRAAVQAFQKANGLAADGVAGPKTRAALAAPATLEPVSKRTGVHVEVDLGRQLLLVVKSGRVQG